MDMAGYWEAMKKSWVMDELYEGRNIRPAFGKGFWNGEKGGLWGGWGKGGFFVICLIRLWGMRGEKIVVWSRRCSSSRQQIA